jgi:hypothetical protein
VRWGLTNHVGLGAPDQDAKVKAQLGRSAELEEINTNTTTIKHMVNFLIFMPWL